MSGTEIIKTNATTEVETLLQKKADWVRAETFRIHKRAPETRVASSLSPIETFTALYYGKVLNFDPKQPLWEGRDRFVISKGHGSMSMYPLLADLGFFDMSELQNVCTEGAFLGGIPDPIIPGYETVNGSLGHGLGVACGMALGLKTAGKPNKVFTLVGDGELNEGSIWEGIMFASHHKLDNFTVIVDVNTKCMLDYTAKVMNLDPLAPKFASFGFYVEDVDGHDVLATYRALSRLKNMADGRPKVLLAQTLKGKGAPQLESNPLCHVTGLKPLEVDDILKGFQDE